MQKPNKNIMKFIDTGYLTFYRVSVTKLAGLAEVDERNCDKKGEGNRSCNFINRGKKKIKNGKLNKF
jgi:hypothetical protein